jgi:uncharacterized protein (DUF1684 family)
MFYKYRSICTGLFVLLTNVTVKAQGHYVSQLQQHQLQYKKELASIIKNDTAYVSFYPINEAFVVYAVFRALRDQPVFNMATSSGKTKQAQKTGIVSFAIGSQQVELSAYQLLALRANPQQQDLFFIPFTDSTSGGETYGAGRYLDFKSGDIIDGKRLIIDFNKAYNPYCAFVDGYNCPVPPPENQLNVAISAGEKTYGKKWK